MLSAQDRQDISDVIIRYCDTIDRHDWPGLRACFSDDFTGDYGGMKIVSGDHLTNMMKATYANLGQALHRMTNIVAAEKDGKVTVRSYVDGLSMKKDGTVAMHLHSTYDDVMTKTTDGWKIQFRYCKTIYIQSGDLTESAAAAQSVPAV
jgi:3-phenylpropionate/cinnamic acid dioxygenase small subunit